MKHYGINLFFQVLHCPKQIIALFNLLGTHMIQISQQNHRARLLFCSMFLVLGYLEVTSSIGNHHSREPYFVKTLLV